MAFGRRQLAAVLLLFIAVAATTGVPVSRSLKAMEGFHFQDVKETENDGVVFESMLERRMTIQLTDYSGTGANRNHDPRPPGN